VADSEKQKIAFIRALPGAGHLSAAVIYVTMGLLAGLAAIGFRGPTPDLRETMRAIREQPFGPIILLLIALGSISLVVWRLLQAFADLERKGTSFVGIFQRARFFVSGLFYGGMPFLVWRMFTGAPVRSGEQWAREAASHLILLPFGWTLLVGVGIGFLSYGGTCIYRMIRGNFHKWFHCERMTRFQQFTCFALGRIGYAARGSIFLIIGSFVVRAGWHLNPGEVSGQAGALHKILLQPYGPLLLGLVAVGLISFGLFSLATLRFGKVPVERAGQLIKEAQARYAAT